MADPREGMLSRSLKVVAAGAMLGCHGHSDVPRVFKAWYTLCLPLLWPAAQYALIGRRIHAAIQDIRIEAVRLVILAVDLASRLLRHGWYVFRQMRISVSRVRRVQCSCGCSSRNGYGRCGNRMSSTAEISLVP